MIEKYRNFGKGKALKVSRLINRVRRNKKALSYENAFLFWPALGESFLIFAKQKQNLEVYALQKSLVTVQKQRTVLFFSLRSTRGYSQGEVLSSSKAFASEISS